MIASSLPPLSFSRLVPVALAALLPGVALADLTVVYKTQNTGMAKMAGDGSRSQLKGNQLRTDTLDGQKVTSSMILDLDAKTMTTLDYGKKRATVYDLSSVATSQQAIGPSDVELSVEPTGESRSILGKTCSMHEMRVAVNPASSPMPVTVVVGGPVCLVEDAPGKEEWAAFYKTMTERGLFMGAPEQAQAQPGQARGMALLHEEMAKKGVGYWSELTVEFEGEGFMAAMFKKLGFSTTSEVVEISTDDVSADVFAPPAGWKVKKSTS